MSIDKLAIPVEFSLSQNYPNPFNPETILFSIPNPSNISLTLYDVRGIMVDKIIDNQYYNIGFYSIRYKPTHLSSGIYL